MHPLRIKIAAAAPMATPAMARVLSPPPALPLLPPIVAGAFGAADVVDTVLGAIG